MALTRIEICEKAKEAILSGKEFGDFIREMEGKTDYHTLEFVWALEHEKLDNDKYRSLELVVHMARRKIDEIMKGEPNGTFVRMKVNKILHDYGFKEES